MNKKLFNKRYIYEKWDDILIDKYVICGDDKKCIKDNVNNFRQSLPVYKSDDELYPFQVMTESGDLFKFKYCYFDPNYDVKVAFDSGNVIEVRWGSESGYEWVPCYSPTWDDNLAYRVR